MNDDELKKLWQQQPLREPAPSAAQLVSAMQNKMTGLRRLLDARDLRELVACAVVVVMFGIFYFTVYREPISRLGALIVIGSTIFIAGKIIHTRRITPPAPPGATVVEALRAELNAVRTQSRLLKSVFWWYLLPLLSGMLVATWGLRIELFSKIFSTLVFLAINAGIWRLNQWARAKQLLPAEAQLESLLHSAETGEPPGETHVANLRPLVLSMAAADQVKPVEFKVAFWQLAIFGIPGIVGIWFFLMLSLSIDEGGGKSKAQFPKRSTPSFQVEETNRFQSQSRPFESTKLIVSRMFTWPRLLWLVAFFLGGLFYSWLIQKQTQRAVGISSLGVHLQKGQHLILWDEITEARPFRFLHIRNIWLSRESGEKTLMHWTPLERHADLKAAVEAFAPANHPLRKHLPLLKRIKLQ